MERRITDNMMVNPASKELLEELRASRKQGRNEDEIKEVLLKKYQQDFSAREIALFMKVY
ncbi:MAG: hypothetical protein LKF01_00585 [Lactobacillus sp.]|nr:hypothetical protein [Lactobacillus sp.]MCH3906568.1 hypothetical protein [Lactobacillus sp.]MCH3989796.1 hypothetical protein [Lactobacillus sp.]MCH4068038.1 hypothetical protein [Lactobacillus sp.]MCI1304006.1 hypothetical protein [Lactobacillus sp.]